MLLHKKNQKCRRDNV